MAGKMVYFYSEAFQRYDMGPQHPLRPIRLARTHELLGLYGALEAVAVEDPRPCSMDDLLTTHSREFIETVMRLSEGDRDVPAEQFGFGYGDNPIFPGMWESSLVYTGASVDAAQAVNDGRCRTAMNLSGGLHHGHHSRAAGFCIFNDCAVAIHRLRRKFAKVAYIDIDVHHGDGVQEAFYDDPSVLTISIHESGRTLFPGTGSVREIGAGDGTGYSVNVPLWPGTTDDIWIGAFRDAALPILQRFDPDAVLLQMGTDAHYLDPLAHLYLTAQGWLEAVKDVNALSKPIVAVGGGGYNPTTVPRMWALAFGELFGLELPDDVPAEFSYRDYIPRLRDHDEPPVSDEDRQQAAWYAGQAIEELKRALFPIHGLA